MTTSAFLVGRLVAWVVVFVILGGVPKVVFRFLPEEWNRHTLVVASGGKPVYAGEAIHWAPDILLIGAMFATVAGALFVFLHSLTVNLYRSWGGPVSGRMLALDDAPPGPLALVRVFRAFRIVVGLIGVGLILAGVPLFWMAITNGEILDRIGLVKLVSAGGAGLATSAAFYNHY